MIKYTMFLCLLLVLTYKAVALNSSINKLYCDDIIVDKNSIFNNVYSTGIARFQDIESPLIRVDNLSALSGSSILFTTGIRLPMFNEGGSVLSRYETGSFTLNIGDNGLWIKDQQSVIARYVVMGSMINLHVEATVPAAVALSATRDFFEGIPGIYRPMYPQLVGTTMTTESPYVSIWLEVDLAGRINFRRDGLLSLPTGGKYSLRSFSITYQCGVGG